MGWSHYCNFVLQVYLPKRGCWRAVKFLVLEEEKGRLGTQIGETYPVLFFSPQRGWHPAVERVFCCNDVENYPIFVSLEEMDDSYDVYHPRATEWMTMGRGQTLVLPSSGRAVPSWDDFVSNVKEGRDVSSEEYLANWVGPYVFLLRRHYQQLVEFERAIDSFWYTPVKDLAKLEPNCLCPDGEDDASVGSLPQMKTQRMQIYKSCLKVLFRDFLPGDCSVSLVAEFAAPPLPRLRLHFDHGCEG